MSRYKPEDFGYDFASKENKVETQEEEEQKSLLDNVVSKTDEKQNNSTQTKDDKLAATSPPSTVEATLSDYKLYEDQQQQLPTKASVDDNYRFRPAKSYRGGESYIVSEDSTPGGGGPTINGMVCLGGVCCCLTVGLVIVGGILLSYEEYKDTEPQLLAGSILIVLAVAACLCGCCTLCIGASTDGFDIGPNAGEAKGDSNHKEVKVRLRRLNDRYEKGCMKAEESLRRVRLDVVGHIKELKEAAKKELKDKKETEKKEKEELEKHVKKDIESGVSVNTIRDKYRPVTFFIDFHGDLMVSKLELLRKQVSIVVNLGRPGQDRCVVCVTSPGGAVSQYGLAASQLVRIRKAGIHLTVCVDSVAASGGYMMASVADIIYAAPFAVVGSIGVVTQIPNFQRFLNEHKIDAYLMTAGNYKRTIDIIGDVTEEGKAKMTEQLDDIHIAFKDHIALARPKLRDTIEEVGTGEHWLAVQAKEKGLVDEIMTSDEYLESISGDYDIIEILEKHQRKGGMYRLFGDNLNAAAESVRSVAERIQQTAEGSPGPGPTPMAIV